MSSDLYMTGLWYHEHGSHGRAKLHGREVLLSVPPVLPDLEVVEIEYVPEVHARRLRERTTGWRDMESHEVRAADALLKMMFPDGGES